MKTRVGVIFGGQSVEHEVSVISALQALHALDKDKYEPVPLYIAKTGAWYTGQALMSIESYKDLKGLFASCEQIVLSRSEEGRFVLKTQSSGWFKKKDAGEIDVAFPVIHGTLGEDGSLQGYLELLGIPYAGCDVTSSALGMDKVIMKKIVNDSQLPIVDYVWFYAKDWHADRQGLVQKVTDQLGFPVIVKPANLGSSVGVGKAADAFELEAAVNDALSYAHKVIIEQMIVDLTEVNCSVLGDYSGVQASVCEQVMSSSEILSYQDKYMNNPTKGMSGTNRIIPAELPEEVIAKVQHYAKETFLTLGCSGVSRIDFLINRQTMDVYVNEINTIPGSLSFYLWEHTGKSFTQLTHEMIQLAFKRQRERGEITFSFDTNLLAMKGKGGKSGFGVKG